ncbi:hypothetical protein QR680_019379 [Steinernema hermaphroditum]|uniref:MADF domain-containing protein n=1 Tax=Steinernema hermaphroditum TaxID=289476 RepID=A0AA39LAF4_9BILA|nr:hypothetical protein QR680_019379 [Steinernema hermaphroditum]
MQQNNEAAGAVKVTDDVKTHIIDLVKRKDILWKVKSRGYKLDAEKSAAYLEISNQVNELHSLSLKGEDIQNIFKNLKDSYMRRLKSAKKAMGNTGDGAKSKKREDKFIFSHKFTQFSTVLCSCLCLQQMIFTVAQLLSHSVL